MNRPIRTTSILILILFLALLANLSINWLFRSDSLLQDSRNRRVQEASFQQNRGAILAQQIEIANTKELPNKYRLRTYPQKELYAHILGYYSFIYGRSGLENSYNKDLSGSNAADLQQRIMDSITGKLADGNIVKTTLVPQAQEAAMAGLQGYNGALVAINYETGAILAYASNPSYDPNKLAAKDNNEVKNYWQKLQQDSDRPLADRAGKELYPPGSTFKVVVSAAALEDGQSPDTVVDAPHKLKLPGTNTYISNAIHYDGDKLTLAQALAYSSNTAFANVGLKLGQDKIRDMAHKFGFGERLLTDIPSVPGRFPEKLSADQLAMSSFGQFEVAANPLQMALVAATVANDGVLMKPYLVDSVLSSDRKEISRTKPQVVRRVMSATNAQKLQEMMGGVGYRTKGTLAGFDGLTTGAKTGSAQSKPDAPSYSWFIIWAKEPKIAIAVFLETNHKGTDLHGGVYDAPIAAKVMAALR